MNRETEYYIGLVQELRKLPKETEWAEFKKDNDNPQEIGEYISALSNSAAFNGKTHGYMLWGIENETHDLVGTNFKPSIAKKGNEPLETWLLRLLNPKIHFTFLEIPLDGCIVVLLEIARASKHPVSFSGTEYIRIGEVKKALKEAPEREAELWRIFDKTPFEELVAAERVSADDVLQLLDYPAYFDLLEIPLPSNRDGILDALAEDGLICRCSAGGWNITNLGAILFAKRLDKFKTLRKKAVRVIRYTERGRTETLKELPQMEKGYAAGFENLMGRINDLVPAKEEVGQALREPMPMIPASPVRELVANALIHQDFFVTGAGPMVEIFSDRIEITNPGEPLVDTRRFLDTPPKSRNEELASLMRRFRICEERGIGIDKTVSQTELHLLPAPLFEVPPGFTRAVLFGYKKIKDMDKADRVRACYLHACLKYVERDCLTNASLRIRFGIKEKNKASVSRIIREAVKEGAIKPFDADAAPKLMKYIPFWA